MEKKKGKGKKIVIILVIIAAVAAAVCFGGWMFLQKNSVEQSTGETVDVFILQKQDMSTYVTGTGTVKSQNVVDVTTDLQTTVKELDVALGDHVEEGQTLCILDTTELEQQIADLQSQIDDSNAALEQQRVSAQNALTAAQNQKDNALYWDQQAIDQANAILSQKQSELSAAEEALNNAEASGDEAAISAAQQAYEQAQAEVNSAQTEVNSAQRQYDSDNISLSEAVQNAQDSLDSIGSGSSSTDQSVSSSLAKLQRQVEQATIKAPQAGTITALNVSAGSAATGTLMTIQDSNNLQVTVTINERDIKKIATDMRVIITSKALEDQEINGKVTRVIDFVTGSVDSLDGQTSSQYSADIQVTDSDSGLLLGMNVQCKIVVQEAENLLAVPYDSLINDGTNDYVYRAVDNGDGTYSAEKVIVTKGTEGDYYTVISSANLQEGDYIVNDPYSVTEGVPFAITDVSDAIASSASTASAEQESTSDIAVAY